MNKKCRVCLDAIEENSDDDYCGICLENLMQEWKEDERHLNLEYERDKL